MISDEEKLFYDRIEDKLHSVQRDWTARFTFFLDERQQAMAAGYLKQAVFENSMMFGGFSEAGRKVLGLFPEYEVPSDEAFPIHPVTLKYRAANKPRHQDILGTLMGLEIKRELVGDILIGDTCSVIFLLEPAHQVVLNEVSKIGRVGVTVIDGKPEELPAAYKLEPVSGTVSSLRLDCLVSFFTNLSREKAQQLIRGGLVSLNFLDAEEPAQAVKQGDIFSIRGYGRFVLSQVGGMSKKGRLHLLGHKYCS